MAAIPVAAPIPDEGGLRTPAFAWVVAGAMLILLALCNGVTLAGVSVFDDTMLKVVDTSIGALKFRDLLGLVCSGIAAPFVGRAVDRVGVRPVIGFGLALITLSMLGYAHVQALWQIYAIHVMLGVAFAATNIVVVMVLVAQWFAVRRSVALGVILAGTSVGGSIIPPIVAALIVRFGWQGAFQWLSLAPVLYLPVLLLAVRERRAPDAERAANRTAAAAGEGPSFWKIAATREFLALALVAVAVFYSANTFIRHSFLFLKLNGADLRTAAAGISTVYLFGLFGKLATGFSLEFISTRWVLAVCQLATLTGSALLIGTGSSHATLALALIGLGWGGGYTLVQLVAARYFAGPALGRLLGGFVAIESLSQGLGSFLSGVLHDVSGSYGLPFGVVFVLIAAALVTTLSARAFRIAPGVA